jgi:ubiquinone biosynthesis protein
MKPAVAARELARERTTARRGITRVAHMHRYGEIVAVLVKYGFVDVVDALHLRPYLAAGRRVLAALGHDAHPEQTRAVRLRLTCETLGPAFVKFGQTLSTRADLLPSEVTTELARLQDAVAPLPQGVAEKTIEDALGCPLEDVFLEFEGKPLAAASIAQVHRARLHSGEVVAVKVRRPGIEEIIEADLAILADLASLLESRYPDAALYSLSALVAEFARTIRREQDLVREGRLIDRVASQFAGDPTVRFPRICWQLTRSNVLTMEFLEGTKVSAVGTEDAPGLDSHHVERRGADAVLRQIFVNGLYHADPHPGNVLVLAGNVIAFVDFGIVGRIDRQMRDCLADAVVAIHEHDSARLAEIVVSVATLWRASWGLDSPSAFCGQAACDPSAAPRTRARPRLIIESSQRPAASPFEGDVKRTGGQCRDHRRSGPGQCKGREHQLQAHHQRQTEQQRPCHVSTGSERAATA